MKAVVIGASAGGIKLLSYMLPQLPASFLPPVFVVLHIPEDMPEQYLTQIIKGAALAIKEASHNERIMTSHIYFAPAGYHLLIESENRLSLSVDNKVNYCRPSIDVLFQSAAEIYRSELLGIILSGGNQDGVAGAESILRFGGQLWVQTPETAEAPTLPEMVINALKLPDEVCLEIDTMLARLIAWAKDGCL